jgi:hypothetical protein
MTDMALVYHIGRAIGALTAQLDALPAGTPQTEATALDELINDKYKKLFSLLPKGADEDEALLDLIITKDSVFGADVSHEDISSAGVDQWYH